MLTLMVLKKKKKAFLKSFWVNFSPFCTNFNRFSNIICVHQTFKLIECIGPVFINHSE